MSKVLAYLKSGGDARIRTISRKLDIDEATVELILRQLVQLGYLQVILPEDETPKECNYSKCLGCPRASNCKSLLKAKYLIIEKD